MTALLSVILGPRTQLGVQIFLIQGPEGPLMRIPTKNEDMISLFSNYHHRTNLTALSLGNLGSWNITTLTQNLKFEVPKFNKEWRNVSFVQQILSENKSAGTFVQ
jgi:hypothetical protein